MSKQERIAEIVINAIKAMGNIEKLDNQVADDFICDFMKSFMKYAAMVMIFEAARHEIIMLMSSYNPTIDIKGG